MEKTKDVGLEDVKVIDFVEEAKSEDNTQEIVSKNEEAKLEGITSFPWKNVSHVVIGPNGVSLVPTGTEKKFSIPTKDNSAYPTPGLKPTMLEYDLGALVGSMNAVSNFEKENKTLSAELANTRAELEKVKAELEDMICKKKEAEMPKEEKPVEKKPEEPQPEEKKIEEKPAECEKSKEEVKLEEKKDAVIADGKTEAEHTGNLADAIKLMQVAKKRNLL